MNLLFTFNILLKHVIPKKFIFFLFCPLYYFYVKSNFTNIFGKDISFLALWFWKDLVGKNSNTRRLNLTYVTLIQWFLISRIFFQYRIFLLPRCTAIHPVFLCTVCSIINSSSRQHKTLTPWPDAFSRKISFYFFSCN